MWKLLQVFLLKAISGLHNRLIEFYSVVFLSFYADQP